MNFTVYKSSAGSGKTFTLVKEYLKLALTQPELFRHILAITFTNKAANEMKDRIISNLTGLAKYDPENPDDPAQAMMRALMEESVYDSHTIKSRSGLILRLILHQYSDFAVSTIDSFVHRIIRTFARDLYLPINFEIELEQENLIIEAIDTLISKTGTDEDLTSTLVFYSLSRIEEDKSWNIEVDLRNFAKLLFQEEGQVNIQKLNHLTLKNFSEIHTKLNSRIKAFEKTVKTFGKQAIKLIDSRNINSNSFYQGKSGIAKYFVYLSECNEDKLLPNSFVRDTFDKDKWFAGKIDEQDRNSIIEIKEQLKEIYKSSLDFIEHEISNYLIFKSIAGTIYQLSVLSEIGKLLNEITRDQNLVHISEFNRKISQVVMNEPAPFIYERIGEKYHSFLVDEFQDTSMLQWQNLLPLIDNSLAEGHPNVIVGDGKQAIYRWRNGEVEQFAVLPQIFHRPDTLLYKQREDSLIRNYKESNLGYNFRTRKEIVSFNNRFFSFISKDLQPPLDRIYLNLEQKPLESKEGGYIHLDFFDKKAQLPSFEEYNISTIVQWIEECREDGYALKDIAILFRNNNNANFVARTLIEQGFDIQSNESVLLSNSRVVGFMIAYLKYVLNRSDQISAAVIQQFTGDLSVDRSVWKFIETAMLEQMSVYDACEQIIKQYNLYSKHNPYLVFFMDVVHDYSSSKGSSIHGFLDWWEVNRGAQYLTLPEGLDAIRILTIHKAKGLEFPVVILPFANFTQRNTKDYIWVELNEPSLSEFPVALIRMNKKLEQTRYAEQYREEVGKNSLDYVNMAYVAFTRSIDRLYVLTEKPPATSSGGVSLQSQLSGFLNRENIGIQDGKVDIGIKTLPKRSDKEGLEQSILENILSSDWKKKLFIRQNAPTEWNVFDPGKQRGIGNMVHFYLSLINTNNDLSHVLERINSSLDFSAEEVSLLEKAIKTVISHDELKGYYAEGLIVMNESAILLPDGKLLRPDRVVISNNTATVIDYKTGSYNEHHRQQITEYLKLLKEMGYREANAFLVYIDEPVNIVKVG